MTDNGIEQAKSLGRALPQILQDLNLPSVSAIYSSPFLRCQQTSVGIASSVNEDTDTTTPSSSNLKVRVEIGLAESMNENFFRSWAVEGTDGSWGYKKKEQPVLDPARLHPLSKQPIQQTVLNWKTNNDDASKTNSSSESDNDDNNNANTRMLLVDYEYESVTSIETPYALHPPKFESFKMQRARMTNTMKQLANLHNVDETIILVSHGMFFYCSCLFV